MGKQEIEIIRYDCGWGCLDYGCEDGPDAVDQDALTKNLEDLGHNVIWHPHLNIKDMGSREDINEKETTLPLVVEASIRLAQATEHAIQQGRIPVVIGGDHTAAIGTWSGLIAAHDAFQEFGLIWLDAHMDAHTPDTAHEGKWGGWWHGMPVACLTGEGVDELTQISSEKAKIDMSHFSLLGARSFEPSEEAFMQRHNASIYKMPDVDEHSFQILFAKSLKRATTDTKGFGLSIDLDGFDPEDAPGVGTNEKGGLRAADAIESMHGLAANPLFKGIEIVEYNPHKDPDKRTEKLINDLLVSVFTT